MDIEQIKKAYPNPITWGHYSEAGKPHGAYCVGGAFCNFIDGEFTGVQFPDEDVLTAAILYTNPGIGEGYAKEYAERIIRDNDDGFINEAWNWLHMALAE